MSERPRVYLIDGYSNIYRAFYAIRNLSNTKGEPTNAVFGFLQMLRKLLREENPRYVGVALDVKGDTVRKERYEDYKANRKPMPEDLRPQIPWIRRLLEAYKIPILELEGYEADDVLGTLARKATAAGFEVVLISPDKDLMQLVGDGVLQYHTGRDKLYDAAAVAEDFGVPPAQVADVLALMGDASDNVPGVPGIGEKGAKQLIAEHGSLENLLEHAGEVKRKSYREGLLGFRDQARLSKELVTIHADLPIAFEPDRLVREEPDYETLFHLLSELDFTSVLKELEADYRPPVEPIPAAAEALEPDAWRAACDALPGEICLGRVGNGGEAVGLVVAVGGDAGDERTLFADFRRDGLRAAACASLRAWAADPAVTLVGHDLKEVLRLLEVARDDGGDPIDCRLVDTMLLSYLIQPARHGHSLAEVAFDQLRHTAARPADVGWSKGMAPLLGDARLMAFAAEQAILPRRMAPKMRAAVDGTPLAKVYDEIEAPLVPVLLRMEETGIGLDVDFLAEMSRQLGEEIAALEEQIYELAGERFNLNSSQQLGRILFDKLGLPVLRRTRKTKSYATGAEVLEELAARGYELPDKMLRYRELTKLRSTYVDALPALVAEDGRLHTRFNQAVAATGRLSSANPNLQNIPVRTEIGQRIRKAFRALDGRVLIVADYNQIELRVLAHIAGEEALVESFRRGEDIHASTAAAIFDVSPMLVNPDQRRMAKTINFGILYGMSAWGLAQRLGIGKNEAQRFIDRYMERYPKVRRYIEETVAAARRTGKVETLYGRVRWLPDIKSRNYQLRENAKRMAINARIQGTAADLLKLAMIAVDRRLLQRHPGARLLLTVHDELVLSAPEATAGEVSAEVVAEMEGVAELDVPLKVDVGCGRDWYEAKA